MSVSEAPVQILIAEDDPDDRYHIEAIAKRRVLGYWLVGGGLTIGYAMMRGSAWQGTAQLHTFMEGIATLLALLAGVMALVRFYSKKNNTFLFIGTGFLGTAFLDGYHTLVTSLYFKVYLPSDLPSLIPWSWVASRWFLALLMYLSWLAWSREDRLGEAGRVSEGVVYLFTGTLTLVSFLFFAFVPLPRAYYPEIWFHRPEEFVPALFFLLALVGYLRKGAWRHGAFEHWLVLSLVVGLVGQAVFMSYSGQLFDFEFDAAHTLKKLSYLCVLTGLLISMYAIFKRADEANTELQLEIEERLRAEQELASQAKELARSNEELELFASIASHDLQEPLRKVQAFGDRLKSTYANVLDKQGQDYIGRMQALKLRCQKLGIGVRTTSDVLQVLKLIRRKQPDLLILDINMPAADGLSVCEQLMNDPSHSPLPVIFFSGRSDPETIRRCESLGAHYVVKDSDTWAKLKPLIREILQGQRAPSRPSIAAAPATSPPKVLVVEDDFQLSRALKIRLEGYGVDVLTATSGMQGFWKALKSKPDAIITDYIMPNGDGESLIIRLNSNALLKHIPVIVITGRAEDVENGRDLKSDMFQIRGAAAFFTKPLDFDALIETLGAHVALRPSGSGLREKAHDTKSLGRTMPATVAPRAPRGA